MYASSIYAPKRRSVNDVDPLANPQWSTSDPSDMLLGKPYVQPQALAPTVAADFVTDVQKDFTAGVDAVRTGDALANQQYAYAKEYTTRLENQEKARVANNAAVESGAPGVILPAIEQSTPTAQATAMYDFYQLNTNPGQYNYNKEKLEYLRVEAQPWQDDKDSPSVALYQQARHEYESKALSFAALNTQRDLTIKEKQYEQPLKLNEQMRGVVSQIDAWQRDEAGNPIFSDEAEVKRYNDLVQQYETTMAEFTQLGGEGALQDLQKTSQQFMGYYDSLVNNIKEHPVFYAQQMQNALQKKTTEKVLADAPAWMRWAGQDVANPILATLANAVVQTTYGFKAATGLFGFDEDYEWADHMYDSAAKWREDEVKPVIPVREGNISDDWTLVVPRFMETATNAALMYGGGASMAALAGGSRAALMSSMFVSGTMATMEGYYQSAIEAGMDESDAEAYALVSGTVQGSLEMINPEAALFMGMPKRATKVYMDAVTKGVTKAAARKEAMKFIFTNVGKENLQEFSQNMAGYAVNYYANSMAGTNLDTGDRFWKDMGETAILTTLLAGGIGAIGSKNSVGRIESESKLIVGSNPEAYKQKVMTMMNEGAITKERVAEMNEKIDHAANLVGKLPGAISPDQAVKLIPLVEKKLQLEAEMEKADTAFEPVYEEQIARVQKDIQNIMGIKAAEPEAASKEGAPKKKTSEQQAQEAVPAQAEETLQQVAPVEVATPMTEDTVLPPAEPPVATEEQVSPVPEEKVKASAKRVLESPFTNEKVKAGLEKEGIGYVPKRIDVTDADAARYVKFFEDEGKMDDVMEIVKDRTNGMNSTTRGSIAVKLHERYVDMAEKETDPVKQQALFDKAVELVQEGSSITNEAGQTGSIVGKMWKSLAEKSEAGVVATLKTQAKEKVTTAVEKEKGSIKRAVKSINEAGVFEGKESKELTAKQKSDNQKKRQDLFKRLPDKRAGATKEYTPEHVKDAAEILKTYIDEGEKNPISRFKKDYRAVKDKEVPEGLLDDALEETIGGESIARAIGGVKAVDTIVSGRFRKLGEKGRKRLVSQVVSHMGEHGSLTEEAFKEIYSEVLSGNVLTDEMVEQAKVQVREIKKVDVARKEVDRALEDWRMAAQDELKAGRVLSAKEQKAFKDRAMNAYVQYERSQLLAEEANDKLSALFREDKDFYKVYAQMIQGSLLTTSSAIANVVSYPFVVPLRLLGLTSSSIMDWMLVKGAKVGFNKDVKRSTSVLSEIYGGVKYGAPFRVRRSLMNVFTGKETVKETIEGNEILRRLATGSVSKNFDEREFAHSLNFVKAFAEVLRKPRPGEEKVVMSKVKSAFETVFTLTPDVMFRLMAPPDVAARKLARMGRAYEIAKNKGLKDADLFEETVFPKETELEAIKRSELKAAYQSNSIIAKSFKEFSENVITRLEEKGGPHVAGVARLFKAVLFPFVKTPLNILDRTLDISIPLWGITKAAVKIDKMVKASRAGNESAALDYRRGAMIDMNNSFIAMGLGSVALSLVARGLLTGGGSDDAGERAAQYENIRPYSMNYSALLRMLSGDENWADIHPDDTWVNYQKMGELGVSLGAWADYSQGKSEAEIEEINAPMESLFSLFPVSVMRSTVENSFLKGTNDALQALLDKKGEKINRWGVNFTTALTSPFVPNNVANASRAADDFMRDTKANGDFSQLLVNTYKTRLFMGEDLPTKVTLWGEPVKNVPQGTSPVIYYFFDPLKSYSVNTRAFGYELFDFWKTTQDQDIKDDILPSIPSDKVTIRGKQVQLTPEEYSSYQQLVGKQRAKEAEAYVILGTYEKDIPEVRAKRLKKIYDHSRTRAMNQFIKDTPRLLTIRAVGYAAN
jgi:hypothetical protein